MSEDRNANSHDVTDLVDTREQPDADVSFKWVYIVGAVLVVVTVVYAVLMWPFSSVVVERLEARDPAPSPLAEAAARSLPPAPRLQPDPPQEIEELRAWEERVLSTYGWVDKEQGVVRIPLDRAQELILEEGLPTVPNPAPAGE